MWGCYAGCIALLVGRQQRTSKHPFYHHHQQQQQQLW
jgi:hypothetical protein